MKPSRLMLTGEISWAIVGASFAWSGLGGWPLEQSYLNRALERHDGSILWALAIGVPSLLLLAASCWEWAMRLRAERDPRHRLSIVDVERLARIRGRLCFWMALAWLYIFKVTLELSTNGHAVEEVVRATERIPIALAGALMTFWFWTEGRRVQRDCRNETGVYPAHMARR